METVMTPAQAGDSPHQGEDAVASRTSALVLGLGGPMAMGACLGINTSLTGALVTSVSLPLAILLLGGLTLPGLYVGLALADENFSIRALANIGLKTLDAMGVMMLGLAPAALFLVATSGSVDESILLTTLAMALGVALGLRAFWRQFSTRFVSLKALLPFGVWVITVMGLGWHIYLDILRMGGLL